MAADDPVYSRVDQSAAARAAHLRVGWIVGGGRDRAVLIVIQYEHADGKGQAGQQNEDAGNPGKLALAEQGIF